MKQPAVAFALLIGLASCSGSRASEPLTAASQIAGTPAVLSARSLAPEEYRAAKAALDRARRAADEGRHFDADLLAEEATIRFEMAVASAQARQARVRIGDSEQLLRESERERDENNAARRVEESRIAVLLKQQEIERILEEERQRAEADEGGRHRAATTASEHREREASQRRAAAELVVRAKVLLVAAEALLGQAAETDARAALAREAIAAAERQLQGAAVESFAAATAARAKAQEALTGARRAAAGRREAARLRAEDGALLDELGIAGGLNPRQEARGVIITVRGLFDGRRAHVSTPSRLEPVARAALAHPTYPIVIEAHSADARGRESETAERAEAVARALESLGVPAARLRAVGLGASRPIAPATLTSARERNERIEIVFVGASE